LRRLITSAKAIVQERGILTLTATINALIAMAGVVVGLTTHAKVIVLETVICIVIAKVSVLIDY